MHSFKQDKIPVKLQNMQGGHLLLTSVYKVRCHVTQNFRRKLQAYLLRWQPSGAEVRYRECSDANALPWSELPNRRVPEAPALTRD